MPYAHEIIHGSGGARGGRVRQEELGRTISRDNQEEPGRMGGATMN
jgi:hypothetical protein